MSKIQWEYNLVGCPFSEQLQKMGREWFEGDMDVAELTERDSIHEVTLKGRLAAAIRQINLRDGQPWLDETKTERTIRELERAAGHRLMEINQVVTELLLKGTMTKGLLAPTLYTDNEDVEKLFHTNQLLIAGNFFEARAATIDASPSASGLEGTHGCTELSEH